MTDQEMTLMTQMLEEMRNITGRLGSLEGKVTSREEICALHRIEMAEIKKEVRGNGQPGLKQKVEALEDRFSRFVTRMEVYKAKNAAWAAAGGFVGSGALFVMVNWPAIKTGLQALIGGH